LGSLGRFGQLLAATPGVEHERGVIERHVRDQKPTKDIKEALSFNGARCLGEANR
jgi:hypothetical protein